MSAGFNVPRLYRHILKAAKEFPSKKRAGIIEDIKIEFRDNKNLTDPAVIETKRKLAVSSLEQLEAYTRMDKRSPDWQVSLKGACVD